MPSTHPTPAALLPPRTVPSRPPTAARARACCLLAALLAALLLLPADRAIAALPPIPDDAPMEAGVRTRLVALRDDAQIALDDEDGPTAARARAIGALALAARATALDELARAALDQAIAIAPSAPDWSYHRGVLNQDRGRLDAALD
ncbi:MAG: hypothetical protein AAF772_02140, partial [Acidobacteriota bacterium]